MHLLGFSILKIGYAKLHVFYFIMNKVIEFSREENSAEGLGFSQILLYFFVAYVYLVDFSNLAKICAFFMNSFKWMLQR